MGLVALAVMAAAAAYKGMQQNAQAKSAANMAEYNADVAKSEAKAIEQKSLKQSQIQAANSARKMATLEAGLGASGAVTTEGAPLAILGTQASEFEKDNLMIGFEGQVAASQKRAQAVGDEMQADIYREKGSQAQTAGFINAGTTVMAGWKGATGNTMFGSKTPSPEHDAYLAKKHGI